MYQITIGQTVLSKEHGEGKVLGKNREAGYDIYMVKWAKGIKHHPAHEVQNFSHAHAIKRFPLREEVRQ